MNRNFLYKKKQLPKKIIKFLPFILQNFKVINLFYIIINYNSLIK